MSGIMEHILARRSIRRYTEEPVDEGSIRCLLEAAMAAPSASNRKPWEFIVVTDAKVLDRLRRALIFGRYHAPVAIVVCGNTTRTWPAWGRGFWVQDCSAATQNILLAATGLGLGAVWVGVYPIPAFVRRVRRILSTPDKVIPLCVVYVGHPAEQKEPRTQFDENRVSWQRYDGHRHTGDDREPRRL